MEHIIKYYPVGNADCTLIKLDNGKTIIVDCQILADLTDGHGKQVMFDVKADLLKELKKDGLGRPFVDLFISTHPHDDHCKGFAGNFYHGEVDDYDKDKNKDEIIIEELWITPRGLNNNLSSPAEDIRKEAKRRRKLYEDDKNATSVVVQFGFKIDSYTGYKSRVLMGGDAEHEIWQHILDNNADDEKLKWNIFLAPHHCSWSFFNEPDNKKEIKPSAEAILDKQIGNSAHIIASSNEIKNDDNNPPCYEAKQQYIKKLKSGSSHFLNTATHSKVGNIPQPIVFKINENGKTLKENTTVAGATSISNPAPRAGR